jgi:cell division protein FtsQ
MADPPADGPGGRRAARHGAAISVVAVLAVVLVWVLVFSSVLGAKRLVVHGAHEVAAAQIRSAAGVPRGQPLLRVDTAAVARRIGALPGVAGVSVQVSYPSTVVITVTERVAVGYLVAGGRLVLVDKDGHQFRTVARAPEGLPRFDIAAGGGAAATGQAVATVAGALPRAVLATLSWISASTPSAITLRLRDGRTVRWGSAGRSPDKAQILPALLSRRGTTFDVSNPDVVVAR